MPTNSGIRSSLTTATGMVLVFWYGSQLEAMLSHAYRHGTMATPNAMANMSAVCYKYHYSPAPFIIVPIIGAMFVDILNTGIITLFLNLI